MKQNLKKMLPMLLALAMLISMCPGLNLTASAAAPAYAWYGDGTATEYEIDTASELREFAAIVNGTDENYAQDNFSGKTVVLTADIALAADGLYTKIENVTYGSASWPIKNIDQYVISADAPVWTPIGSSTLEYSSDGYGSVNYSNIEGHIFAGTFDGQNHTVSGVYTGTEDSAAGNTAIVQGLFGRVSGTIKNVTVSGCITGAFVVGGVAAYLDGGSIENCVNNAIVFSDGNTTPNGGTENGASQAGATGGIAGLAGGTGKITGCVNNAVVTCANPAKGGRVAGIVGLINNTTDVIEVTKCVNNGEINGYQYTAGIAGMAYGTAGVIDSCVNTGRIVFHSGGKSHEGGIAGQFNCPITNCYNTANIHSTHTTSQTPKYVGGIAGDRVMGSSTAYIENCYNTGAITFEYSYTQYVGIICGEQSCSTEKCYYLDTALENCTQPTNTSFSDGGVQIYGGTAKTADELKSGDMIALLGEAYQESCGNYPALTWQTVTGHTWGEGVDTDATCLAPSCVISTCSTCGATKSEITGTQLGDHSYKYGSCTVCGEADPSFAAYEWYTTPDADGAYEIDTAEELAQFAAIVNGIDESYPIDTFQGKTVKLTADIDLSAVCSADLGTWNSIGGAAENVDLTITSQEELDAALYEYNILYDNTGWSYKYGTDKNLSYDSARTYYAVVGQIFSGTFDGNGKTISNLYVLATAGYAGLFGNVDGTLKNFTVKGTVTTATGTTECDFVGGVTGKLSEGGRIERVISYVDVDASAKCYNVGGIAGFNGTKNATADNPFTSAENTYIVECVNYGSVYGWSQVGGIAGENAGQILRCANYGDVDALKEGSKAGIGGIAGRNGCNNIAYTAGTIIDCCNFGTIADASNKWVGGITGFNNAASSVKNCYNVGTVYGAGQANAIVGQNEASGGAIVTNCWYLESTMVFDESGVYGGAYSDCGPRTEAEMKAAVFAAILGESYNADDGASLIGDANGGYPVLAWMGGTEAPAIYTVTIPASGTGYTVTHTDSTTVVEGGSFSFSVYTLEGYKITSVMAGETELTAASGVYTVENITSDVTVTITVAEEAAVLYGDLDADGDVDSTDAAIAYQAANGKRNLTESQVTAADVDGDGDVDSTDAMYIYRYANGKLTGLPVDV